MVRSGGRCISTSCPIGPSPSASRIAASTSLSAEGRGTGTIEEHEAIVRAIESGDGEAADAALRHHISRAFTTRLRLDAEGIQARPA